MTTWHVLAPHSDGGHNSIDYSDSLKDAVHLARHWRMRGDDDLAIARGINGDPLRFVVYWVDKEGNEVVHGVYRTVRGAQRVLNRIFDTLPHGGTCGLYRVGGRP